MRNPLSKRSQNLFKFAPLTLVAILLTLVLGTRALAQDLSSNAKDDLKERLKILDRQLEEERLSLHIPGFALAIVVDDKVVFAKGYGHRDLEKSKPVDTATIFAIGSTTKAFTSALVGMMIDDGAMNWDDPVTKFLPQYKMKVDPPGKEILIRDLLCHRTGFRRMGILWAGGNVPREEVVQRAAEAEPVAEFRKKFIYNNVTFMTAGICAAKAAKTNWNSLLAKRLLKPLGMKNTTSTTTSAKKDPNLSLGYRWSKDRNTYVRLPMRNLDSIAPAGSINSNVKDMARWIRFQLGRGKFGDKKLQSRATHDEMWKQQIEIQGEVGYGLGWMLRTWKGQRVVEHGGNIDGFSAEVALLPDQNTGFVLLTNVSSTPFQSSSLGLVFEALYGNSGKDPKPQVAKDRLVGNYHGNFGPFVDTTFKVFEKNGRLLIDVPGQTAYELKEPDAEGKWYFKITDTIAVSFKNDDQDKVLSLTMYQGGMEPEYIREGIILEPDLPASKTTPLLGKYQGEKESERVEVKIANGRLVVVIRNKQAFTFRPADSKVDHWVLRANPKVLQLQFNRRDDGTIKSVTRIQRGKETELEKVVDSATTDNPGVDELFLRIRKAHGALDKKRFAGIRMSGTVNFVNQGAKGKIEMLFSNQGQHVTRMDLRPLVVIESGYDGKRGFRNSTISPNENLTGDKLKQLRFENLVWFLSDWSQAYTDVSIRRGEDFDGKKVFVVSLNGEGFPPRKLFVDTKTNFVLKEELIENVDQMGGIKRKLVFKNYRDVSGLKMPADVVSKSIAFGELRAHFAQIEALEKLPQGAFQPSALTK